MQCNNGKVTSLGSLLGLPVELSNRIAVQKNTKTTIRLTYTGVKWASELAAKEVLLGEQNLNSSQQVWCAGTQIELILD